MFQFLLVLLLLFAPNVNAQSLVSSSSDWIIDTDMGPDDAVAILYFLNQPGIKVKAITIESNGNAHCEAAYHNLQGLLQLVHQTHIPVACGRATPLRGRHQFPKEVLDLCDRLADTPLQKPRKALPSFSAKDLLIQTLKKAQKPLAILAIGPLTTLAEVVMEEPGLKAKIREVYMMGGAVRVPGNIREVVLDSGNRRAEWNMYIDPYAADKLFHSGLALTLVPLDATNRVVIDQVFYQRLAKRQSTAVARFVYSLLAHNKKMLMAGNYYLWDPMAAVLAVDGGLARVEELRLGVRQGPEAWAGATVVDGKRGGRARVVMEVWGERIKDRLLEGIS